MKGKKVVEVTKVNKEAMAKDWPKTGKPRQKTRSQQPRMVRTEDTGLQ